MSRRQATQDPNVGFKHADVALVVSKIEALVELSHCTLELGPLAHDQHSGQGIDHCHQHAVLPLLALHCVPQRWERVDALRNNAEASTRTIVTVNHQSIEENEFGIPAIVMAPTQAGGHGRCRPFLSFQF